MRHHAYRFAAAAVAAVTALALAAPAQAGAVAQPDWMPTLDNDDVVVLVPGTGDAGGADQLGRSRDIGLFGTDPANWPPVRIIDYPAAFGFTIGPVLIPIVGTGTFNGSTDIGSAKAVAAAENHQGNGRVVLNGYSQSAPIAMNAAYLLRLRGTPDEKIMVVVGADSRFPNTGVENVLPSFLPGMLTNGDRDPADLGDAEVYSYCVRGDATCGVGNPLADPLGTLFYLAPGFYLHANMNDDLNDFTEVRRWSSKDGCLANCGNTTYVVYDGGNPWAMMLRDNGVPVSREVDYVISILVPVPEPGVRQKFAGVDVPTPRELQESASKLLGLTVPTSDPDRNAKVRDRLVADATRDDSTPAPPRGQLRTAVTSAANAFSTARRDLKAAVRELAPPKLRDGVAKIQNAVEQRLTDRRQQRAERPRLVERVKATASTQGENNP